jgi:methylglutaconyl-CoA hydratase
VSAEPVLSRVEQGVMHLTLNRADRRNALNGAMIDGLLNALEAADLDAAVRVVALSGAGQDFCAGADLTELLASADRPAEENEASALRLGDVFVRMRALPKPVVAVVRGRALAGGAGLVTACDIASARTDATFGYPEVQRGFVPAMVLAMLRRAVGEKVAFDLVATGRLLSADEAARVGLVARLAPAEAFDEAVSALLRDLTASSASALALTKRQLYAIDGMDFSEAIRLGARVNALARTTPDFRAAAARFLKR